MQAEVITAAERLAELEASWQALWEASRGATTFQSPYWLIPWWQVFAPGRLASIAIWDEERLVALAPLYLEDGALGRRLLPLGIGISDHLDVLLTAGRPDAAAELARGIAELGFDWDVLELEELSPDADGFGLPSIAGTSESGTAQSACPIVSLGEALDASGLPLALPGKRRQLVRRAARLVDGGEAELPPPWRFMDVLETLHGARWAIRAEAGVLADRRVGDFHRLALPRLRQAGLVRQTVALIGGEPVAALYQLCWRDCLATYISGFDPAFTHESPLTFLYGDAFAHAAARKLSHVSFLRGQEPYKYLWGARDAWNRRRSFRRQHG